MKYKYLLYLLTFLFLSNAQAAIEGWQISGRVGIITTQEGQTVSYRWIQDGKRYFIQFIGPLGSGTTLTGYPSGVKLKNQEGRVFTGHNPEALLRAQVGWTIPVSNLYYWIRGESAPNVSAKAQYDEQHHLVDLTQQGWHIQYQDYTPVDGFDLPRRINLTQKNVKVKIFINKWHIKN